MQRSEQNGMIVRQKSAKVSLSDNGEAELIVSPASFLINLDAQFGRQRRKPSVTP